ncbi:hypothetical protein PFISCL1PPCAC_14131, partial [Pristionchus fissidentatus]
RPFFPFSQPAVVLITLSPTNEMMRNCLICDAEITQIHMGIGACRACAVFYRRARRSKSKIQCKRSSGNCAKEGRILDCRSCRFDLMREIFERAQLDIVVKTEPIKTEDTIESERALVPDSFAALEYATKTCPNFPPTSSFTPVLDRIRCGYNVMARIRKCAELCMRPVDKFVHPQEIDDESFPIIIGTQSLFARATQILQSSIFDFASIAFPEFVELPKNEKWHLVRGCYERIHIIESSYRAVKVFPHDSIIFISYTMTLSTSTIEHFFSDCEPNINIEEGITTLRQTIECNAERTRGAMRRANLSEEEFLVLIALAFWNNDTITAPESINRMATANRAAIMRDLQAFYASNGLNDYANRLGELFCLLVSSERVSGHVAEDLEMLRVLNLYQDTRPY